MIVYRLTKEKHLDLSGKGAEIYGGRWNSKGHRMLYTSSSRALAMAECLVHLYTDILPPMMMMIIYIPDQIEVVEVKQNILKNNWDEFPPKFETRHFGDQFLDEKKYLLMKVPSAVVQGDFNILCNPLHIQFAEIKIVDTEIFRFDRRLLRR